MRCRLLAALLALLMSACPAAAAPHECRIPLRDGKLRTADVAQELLNKLHLRGVALNAGSIDLSGVRGAVIVQAMNAAFGDGCRVSLDDDALVLHVDPEQLPHSIRDAKKAARLFTASAAPDATANQRRFYGLLMPRHIENNRPMVVLIHGLDCDRTNWYPMAELLIGEGFQVSYFTHPSDGPLADSSQQFAREMRALRENFPDVPLNIIAHSMGGLVARDYVEGNFYAGGVGHLILIGTPNLGTKWATYRIALEAQEHFGLWKHEPTWSPTWMITDGLGEAGSDLKPTSRFLIQLNSRPRRQGVAYTIIAGSQHPIYQIGADAVASASHLIPARMSHVWGFRQADRALEHAADKLRNHSGKSDGPVKVANTKLAGVDDFVVLPADHAALYYPVNGQKPAAWEVIKDRLAR